MNTPAFQSTHTDRIWQSRYQWVEPGHMREPSLEATWERVAVAVSGVESHRRDLWRERFRNVLEDFSFLPASQVLAVAGTTRRASLLPVYCMAAVDDSIQGIFDALRESMVTLQAGAGVRVDFSTLRPWGAAAQGSGSTATGPLSFMSLWVVAHAVLAAGHDNLAPMVATLRCDHPDIERFIDPVDAVAAPSSFRRTVLISDTFMQAVQECAPWPLVFPEGQRSPGDGVEICERAWPPENAPQRCRVHKRISAVALWESIQASVRANSGLRLEFADRVRRGDNLWYLADTPLGGRACGDINLSRCVRASPSGAPVLDIEKLKGVTAVAVRFLDNVHDLSLHPLRSCEKASRAQRRLGLGLTGLAALFDELGLRYTALSSLKLTHEIMRLVRDTVYETSVDIAREKGSFPEFDKIQFAAGAQVLDLPHALQDAIAAYGIRNGQLLHVAPDTAVDALAENHAHGIAPTDAASEPASADDCLNLANIVQSYTDGVVDAELPLPATASVDAVGLALWQAWESNLKACSARMVPVKVPELTH